MESSNSETQYSNNFETCFKNANNNCKDIHHSYFPHSLLCYYHPLFEKKGNKQLNCFSIMSFLFYKLKLLNGLKWIVSKIDKIRKNKDTDEYQIAVVYYRYSFVLAENNFKSLAEHYFTQCKCIINKLKSSKDYQTNIKLLETLKLNISKIQNDNGCKPNDKYYFIKENNYTCHLVRNLIKIKVLFLPSQNHKNDIEIYPRNIYLTTANISIDQIIQKYNEYKYFPPITDKCKCFIYKGDKSSRKVIIYQTLFFYLNNNQTIYYPPNTFKQLQQSDITANIFVIISPFNSNLINEAHSIENNLLLLKNVQLNKNGGLSGFKNIGNTCYMNASLQCIVHCPLLVKHFLDKNNSNQNYYSSFVEEFYNFLKEIWIECKPIINPNILRKEFVKSVSKFSNFAQHDSPEMITDFLNLLGSHLTDNKIKYAYLQSTPEAEKESIKHKCEDNSIIDQLFYGVLENKYNCIYCRQTKYNYDNFLLLDLPVPKTGTIKISDCFNLLTKRKEAGKTCKVKCSNPKCKKYVNLVSKIAKLPKYLIIYLKKFEVSGKNFRKVQVDIKYSDKLIIESEWVSNCKEKYEYNLMSVSIHYGSVEGGHYVARAKVNNKWILFNDSKVSQVNSCYDNDALVLFYERNEKNNNMLSRGKK